VGSSEAKIWEVGTLPASPVGRGAKPPVGSSEAKIWGMGTLPASPAGRGAKPPVESIAGANAGRIAATID
jgi:hypothetical protein